MTVYLPLRRLPPPTSYTAIGDHVFNGEALVFGGGEGEDLGGDLINAARELCCDTFKTKSPQTAHRFYSPTAFFDLSAAAQETFNTPPYKALFKAWLRGIGIATESLYWDTLGLRIAPPVATHSGGFRSHVNVHRDTWGAGIQAQINWWAPILPLANGRTMAFYPAYWTRPLANSTAEWSFADFIASRKLAKAESKGKAAAYPSAPQAKEMPRGGAVLTRLLVGDLLCFSAAQLHSSVPNRTPFTRFSFEIRTVGAADIRRRRGAPNVDCASAPPLYRLFRGIKNGASLQEAMQK